MRPMNYWLRGLVPLAAIGLAAGCDESDDVDDFFVVSVTPGDQQTNVATGTNVVVRMNAPVDTNTLGGNQVILVDQANSQQLVSVTVNASLPEFITITPVTPLSPNITYGVAVRENVASTLGEQVVAPFAMTFSTGPTLATIPGWPPFLVPNPTPPNAGPPGTFTLTGQMVTGRARHEAVLLQSLDVAVFGGLATGRVALNGNGSVLRSAEIYSRTTGTWRTSISNNSVGMAYPRYGHTATLLDNGNVLITGGGDERTIWDTAETYDPRADAFSPTSTFMQNSRQYHTATHIGNGNVVLTGGFTMSVALVAQQGGPQVANTALITNSLEVYDVPSGTFLTSTQSMRREKMYHTATLLQTGDVMMAGGYIMPLPWLTYAFWCPTTNLCDVYRPDISTSAGQAGVLEPTGNLKAARMNHTANGYTTGNAQGLVVVMGGYETAPFTALLGSAEVYDPSIPIANGFKGDWSLVAATMSRTRRAHSTTFVGTGANAGRLVLVGGAITQPYLQPILPPAPPHFWPATDSHNCGFCAATMTAERFDAFGGGQALLQPWRGIDITGMFDWTRDYSSPSPIPAMPMGGTLQSLMVGMPVNPVTNSSGRYFHSATALQSGHILLAGGYDCPFCIPPPGAPYWSGPERPLATCELFNP